MIYIGILYAYIFFYSFLLLLTFLFYVDNILDVLRMIKPMRFNSVDSSSQVREAAATVFSTKKMGK